MTTPEAGWAIVWNQPSFAAARDQTDRHPLSGLHLHPTLAEAHRMAEQQVYDDDTHKARVFWVVRAR